jgi:hypothetical protein
MVLMGYQLEAETLTQLRRKTMCDSVSVVCSIILQVATVSWFCSVVRDTKNHLLSAILLDPLTI